MSNIAWSITSTKRKTKSTSSAARKRRRLHDTDGTSSSRPSKSQQTLTQAQWVTTFPPSHDEGGTHYLDDGQIRTALPRKHQRSVQKPNSTLTQMDFFDFLPRDYTNADDTMLGVVKREDDGCVVPQLDGTYDSPRKPRRRKASPNRVNPSIKNAPSNGARPADYKPSERKRKIGFAEEENAGSSGRRTSKRLAAKNEVLSDPVNNFDYFAEALAYQTGDIKYNTSNETFNYPLEIKNSTESEGDVALDPVSGSRCSVLPQTPKKKTTVVLSSQSPESLCPSTHRGKRKANETPSRSHRAPLAERSANIPVEATSTGTAGKGRWSLSHHLPKRKIVVLKFPKQNRCRRPTRTDHSQGNLWSIPSSSPELVRMAATAVQPHTTLWTAPEHFEIPATSQGQGSEPTSVIAGSQDNLNLSSAFTSRSSDTRAEGVVDSAQQGNRGVIVRDFAVAPATPVKSALPGCDCHIISPPSLALETQDAKEPVNKSLQGSWEDADFGSPVENDTQFNIRIQHRMSSPTLPGHSPEQSEAGFNAVLPSTRSPVSGECAGGDNEGPYSELPDVETLRCPESPLPLPRLVEIPSAETEGEAFEVDNDADGGPLPKPTFIHPSSIHRKMVQVPLNDTLQTSSPHSLSMARLITQRSVHPASMPHPSQISTQEGTQGFLLQSSFTQHPREAKVEGQSDKITIKDSSSSSIPLSQIPHHVGEDQSQWDDDIGPAQEFASEDDLDLDPPSLPPQPCRPQPAPLQLTTEQITGSKSRSETAIPTKDNHTPEYQRPRSCSQPNDLQPDSDSTPVCISEHSLPSSPDHPPPLEREYSPIHGFNNETQSNFTQNGHVTAAYIHRQREAGIFPKWFVPTPYQVPGYTRRK
ncbi:uncharacterized protein Z519_05815 [Cladophialophora bantiana CBS 173.52]|uniref:Uncharacterized protein n=1 Tax=Cladophialophora bantiana (strain ATCC 10958 / CBS 173.52 / CDC B-1940 / NIH 8579) TaxID=1442370 RepID=A0A0D2HQT3_CLAB1|nr:uncharacterized protein Z519_05815 [Cladophialophora bantiana CBS 173.52]KIW93210.1 hypothetical protein Z519_05815 [Cladophialophora bantiana CBS 173.52]